MSTLDVVAEVLREVAPRALKAKQIAQLAKGRLPTESKTPETVVSRDLALDVKMRGARSRFMRVDRGAFVLKEALPRALYNDNEPYVAAWTKNLITAGEIAPGVVDERSIRDLKPADVASHRQFHAFSGIGVWSRALRDAGIPDDANVWTGSCPCQGWSQAGRKKGFEDDRHLWPDWFRLISACRPALLFTEQVASKDGRSWLDAVLHDLARADYACQAYDLPAASVGAPHKRQRLYIVAYARERGREILSAPWLHDRGQRGNNALGRGTVDDVAARAVPDTERVMCDEGRTPLAHGRAQIESDGHREVDGTPVDLTAFTPGDRIRINGDPSWGGSVGGFWADDVEWIYCRPTPGYENGCFRPAKSDVEPLVNWSLEEMGRTRAKRLMAYGNGIVRPQAVEFVGAVIDSFADAARAQSQESAA